MKTKTLQIIWHAKEPVFSLDFHPASPVLATGGADKDIRVFTGPDGSPAVKFLSSAQGHSSAVNCVRFSPTGGMLVAAGDAGQVTLWRPAEEGAQRASIGAAGEEEGEGPFWKRVGSLAGHTSDVQDLCWSPDGSALVSGSVDAVCILWNVRTRRCEARLEGHHHFVQGVAWDPAGCYLVSQSNDRTCKVYGQRTPAAGKKAAAAPGSNAQALKEFVLQHTLAKRALATALAKPEHNGSKSQPVLVEEAMNNHVTPNAGGATATTGAGAAAGAGRAPAMAAGLRLPDRHHMFLDEAMATFFRRLSWSPDGTYLAVPAGTFREHSEGTAGNATYLFARGDWSAPSHQLPALHKPSVAVRFCPTVFSLRTLAAGAAASQPFLPLPYRLVFAVATTDSVFLYDSQSAAPLALLGALHFATITDLSWSHDGAFLAVSSQDGYCSLVSFEPVSAACQMWTRCVLGSVHGGLRQPRMGQFLSGSPAGRRHHAPALQPQGELGEPLPLDQLPPRVAALVSRQAAHSFAEKMAAQDAEVTPAKVAAASAPHPGAIAANATTPVADTSRGGAAEAPAPAAGGPATGVAGHATSTPRTGSSAAMASQCAQPQLASVPTAAAAATVTRAPCVGPSMTAATSQPHRLKRIQPVALTAAPVPQRSAATAPQPSPSAPGLHTGIAPAAPGAAVPAARRVQPQLLSGAQPPALAQLTPVASVAAVLTAQAIPDGNRPSARGDPSVLHLAPASSSEGITQTPPATASSPTGGVVASAGPLVTPGPSFTSGVGQAVPAPTTTAKLRVPPAVPQHMRAATGKVEAEAALGVIPGVMSGGRPASGAPRRIQPQLLGAPTASVQPSLPALGTDTAAGTGAELPSVPGQCAAAWGAREGLLPAASKEVDQDVEMAMAMDEEVEVVEGSVVEGTLTGVAQRKQRLNKSATAPQAPGGMSIAMLAVMAGKSAAVAAGNKRERDERD